MGQRNGRRLVVDPRCAAYAAGYRDALTMARGELYAADFETQVELRRLRNEVAQLRQVYNATVSAMRELQAAALARAQAHAELTSLYREREIARARQAERDSGQPLH
jgi:hypothetical protein